MAILDVESVRINNSYVKFWYKYFSSYWEKDWNVKSLQTIDTNWLKKFHKNFMSW